MNDDEIAIKPADKGIAIVVWSKKDYSMEPSSHFMDTTVYQKCWSPPLQKVNKEIKDVLRNTLNRKEIDKRLWTTLLWKNTIR